MGIKNNLKKSWFVLTDETYEFEDLAEDYDYPISRYDSIAIGPNDWNMSSSGTAGFRISATRRELMELLRDFKDTYPNAHVTVLKS